MSREELTETKAVEVGNIFSFGSRYSEPLGLFFTDEKGIQQPVFGGSYGIGVSRLMGLLAELFADDKGLVWPEFIAPFTVYLASLGNEPEVLEAANQLYDQLNQAGIATLYDDRDERPGEKFADADLFGTPYRVVVSQKSLQAGGLELKSRTSTDTEVLSQNELLSKLTKTGQD